MFNADTRQAILEQSVGRRVRRVGGLIRMSRRDDYMQALEAASVKGQITPLAEFIAQEMREWVPDRTGKS
jgi:hypothetical protein